MKRKKNGKVFLVGAGPGDPGLMTIRGLDCLQHADVVVYDRLLDKHLLESARPHAKKIDVGKSPHHHTIEQEKINRLLIGEAQKGKKVVRLKGGDPFVFGRGGEEAEALAKNNISFEVVPGVSSVTAAPAYAGIPVTDRRYSSSFTAVTGHRAVGTYRPDIRRDRIGKGKDTLVFLMGVGNLAYIVNKLVENGKPLATPVAIIKHGTIHRQRTLVGTLGNIIPKAKREGLQPPAVIVIGEVVRLRKQLRWFDIHPLFGKRILVTRAEHQAKELSQLLLRYGAIPIETPGIEIQPASEPDELDRAISGLKNYQWIIFTSTNGVEAFFRRLNDFHFDSRRLYGLRVGAIGSATASALEDKGIIADCIPKTYTSKGLLAGFQKQNLSGKRVLLPRADIAGKELARGLARLGAEVREVRAYRTVPNSEGILQAKELLLKGEIDIIIFTSSSTVNNLTDGLGEERDALKKPLTVCIGPQTAAEAVKAGLRTDVVARKHTMYGLVEAIEQYFRGGKDE